MKPLLKMEIVLILHNPYWLRPLIVCSTNRIIKYLELANFCGDGDDCVLFVP